MGEKWTQKKPRVSYNLKPLAYHLSACVLTQADKWLQLRDIQEIVKERFGYEWCTQSFNNVLRILQKEGFVIKKMICLGSMGNRYFYQWKGYDFPEPDENEMNFELFDPFTSRDEIKLEVQLFGEERERYSLLKEKRDRYYGL